MIAALGEYVDRDAGNAAGGPVHEHFASTGRRAVELAQVHRQRSRVARDTEGDRFERCHALGHATDPVSRHPSSLGVATVPEDTEAMAVRDDRVSRSVALVS